MAVKFTLKRMTPLLLPAITVLVIPPLISISVVGLNIISRGYGVASILFALAFTAITCWKIKELAPSPQKL
jgi:FtsH-binding integral membrane protein